MPGREGEAAETDCDVPGRLNDGPDTDCAVDGRLREGGRCIGVNGVAKTSVACGGDALAEPDCDCRRDRAESAVDGRCELATMLRRSADAADAGGSGDRDADAGLSRCIAKCCCFSSSCPAVVTGAVVGRLTGNGVGGVLRSGRPSDRDERGPDAGEAGMDGEGTAVGLGKRRLRTDLRIRSVLPRAGLSSDGMQLKQIGIRCWMVSRERRTTRAPSRRSGSCRAG